MHAGKRIHHISVCSYTLLAPLLATDVIWVILSVEVGGLLGVTQQLSSFQAEFSTQPHRRLDGDYNPFASPEKSKCPNSSDLPNEAQQDQNGLSQHNSVDLVANSLQSNLSIVSYNQVRHFSEKTGWSLSSLLCQNLNSFDNPVCLIWLFL